MICGTVVLILIRTLSVGAVASSFYANIYVVKDPANPQNEGGVFLYRFGRKIFDKIMESMQPEFEDETPINPFDFWQGANFKLKLKKVQVTGTMTPVSSPHHLLFWMMMRPLE